MKSGNIILGILAGFSTGALIGLLFAPEKGAVTRKRIFGRCDHYTNTLKVEFDYLVNTIIENCECSKQEAEEWVASGKTIKDIVRTDFKNKT